MAIEQDFLHTGNSAIESTFGNEQEDDTKIEAISEQQRHLQELLPNVQWLTDTLDDEIEAIKDIRAYIKDLGTNPSAGQVIAEYRARELYIALIERLKGSITDMTMNATQSADNA